MVESRSADDAAPDGARAAEQRRAAQYGGRDGKQLVVLPLRLGHAAQVGELHAAREAGKDELRTLMRFTRAVGAHGPRRPTLPPVAKVQLPYCRRVSTNQNATAITNIQTSGM